MIRIHVSSPRYSDDASLSIVKIRVMKCLEPRFQLTDNFQEADLHIHVGTPDSIQRQCESTPLIAYTFAEATRVPKYWINRLDKCDLVWAGSKFTASSLVESGFRGPMETIPLGIEYPEAPTRRMNESPEVFTFMWQGVRSHQYLNGDKHDGDRKRGALVEKAFLELNIPGTRLIIKSLPVEGRSYDIRVGNIWRICRSLSQQEMRKLHEYVDIFVWPTMGEGFGLLPLEKLAEGIPSIATHWSGPMDYLSDFKLPQLTPSRLSSVLFNGEPAQMADVQLDELVALMRHYYEARNELVALRSQLHTVAKQWDYKVKMQQSMSDSIHGLMAIPIAQDKSCL